MNNNSYFINSKEIIYSHDFRNPTKKYDTPNYVYKTNIKTKRKTKIAYHHDDSNVNYNKALEKLRKNIDTKYKDISDSLKNSYNI